MTWTRDPARTRKFCGELSANKLFFGGDKLVVDLPGAKEPEARLRAAETFFGTSRSSNICV
jgi:hypothetical protein